MNSHVVLQDDVILFVGSCAVDANNELSKRLPGATVVVARLNAVTDEGATLLAAPM